MSGRQSASPWRREQRPRSVAKRHSLSVLGAERFFPRAALQLLQHRLGARHREFARLLDVERLDDSVFDQHRVALRADAHAFLDAVELEAHGTGKLAAAVAEHHDLALGPMLLAPGTHHEGVVDRHTRDRIDALGLERGNIADIARQVALRAGPGIGAGHREQHALFAAEQLVRGDFLDPLLRQIAQRHRRDLVTNLDCHRSLLSHFCPIRKTALPGICRSRSSAPTRVRSCQPCSEMRGRSDPSAISPAKSARSGPKRSSASEVKKWKPWIRAFWCSAKSRKLIAVGSPEELPKTTTMPRCSTRSMAAFSEA